MEGTSSSSGIRGRQLVAPRTDWWTTPSLEYSSEQLLTHPSSCPAPPVMTSPSLDPKRAVPLTLGPAAFLIPSYMPLTLPMSTACWMDLQRSIQYSFIWALTSFWTSLLADLKVLSDSGDGLPLYACRAIHLASMRGSSPTEPEWHQSLHCNASLLPKVPSAAKRAALPCSPTALMRAGCSLLQR